MLNRTLALLLTIGCVSTAQAQSPFDGPFVGITAGLTQGAVSLDQLDSEVFSGTLTGVTNNETSRDGDFAGYAFEGTAGYGHVFDDLYVGIEALIGIDGSSHSNAFARDIFNPPASFLAGSTLLHLESNLAFGAAAKLGYLINPGVLLYMRGGYLNTGFDLTFRDNRAETPFDVINEERVGGFLIGAGGEIALAPHVSLRGDYSFRQYKELTGISVSNSTTLAGITTTETDTLSAQPRGHQFGIGLTIRQGSQTPKYNGAYSGTLEGFYVGITGGPSSGHSRLQTQAHIETSGGSTIDDNSRFGYGFQGMTGEVLTGYGRGFGQFYAGAEGFYQFGQNDSPRNRKFTQTFREVVDDETREVEDTYGGAARIGWLPAPQVLAFFRAGYISSTFHFEGLRTETTTTGTTVEESFASRRLTGFLLGAGGEWALCDWLALRADYAYADYGERGDNFSAPPTAILPVVETGSTDAIRTHRIGFGVTLRMP